MSRKKKSNNGESLHLNGNGNGNGNGNSNSKSKVKDVNLKTKKPVVISAKTENQKKLLKSIKENIVTIVSGYPGSGKTLLAVVSGLREFMMGKYEKMIFTRPCVEANGESLGFLPGDLNEKIHPYMIPIFDFLSEYLTVQEIDYLVSSQKIITLPLAFQRGCTFKNSFVILDEGQNTKPDQIRMFLTRIGENCKIVITGDPYQSDIKGKNGLMDSITRLEGVNNLGIVYFGKEDILRNPIVAEIEERYEGLNHN